MEISGKKLGTSFSSFLRRFHILVFTIVVLGGLIYCMFVINDIIAQSASETGYTPASTDTSFDQQTIDKLSQLHPSSAVNPGSDLNLSGRVNPFVD